MDSQKVRGNDIKHALYLRGLTIKQIAEENNWKYRDVSDVVRGIRFGNWGVGREIREKIDEILSRPVEENAGEKERRQYKRRESDRKAA